MPNQPPPTILSLKADFLTTQTRTLSQPLAPSRTFITQNDSSLQTDSNSEGIPPKPLTEALTKLNHTLTQHSRRAYPPVATRHVAEQIDKLYFSSASVTSTSLLPTKNGDGHSQEIGDDDEDEDDEDNEESSDAWLRVNSDLTNTRLITSLPDTWSSVSEAVAKKEEAEYPMEARRFSELVSQLKELDAQKQQTLKRVARLKKMKKMVEGFEQSSSSSGSNPTNSNNLETEAAGEAGKVGGEGETGAEGGRGQGGIKAVQGNLVTKNGEMEVELQRMRVLLARVGGRVEKLDKQRAEKEKERERERERSGRRKRAREGDDGEGVGDERRKVDKLLEMF